MPPDSPYGVNTPFHQSKKNERRRPVLAGVGELGRCRSVWVRVTRLFPDGFLSRIAQQRYPDLVLYLLETRRRRLPLHGQHLEFLHRGG